MQIQCLLSKPFAENKKLLQSHAGMVARLELTAVSVSFYGCIDLSITDCKSERGKSQQPPKQRLFYGYNLDYSLNDTAFNCCLHYNRKEGVTGELEK